VIEFGSILPYNVVMSGNENILDRIRAAATVKVLFLSHALLQMLRPDRMITRTEVRRVIAHGEVIENYPENARGHSCLMLGFGNHDRPIHVVCAPREDYLAIITAYLPNEKEWSSDFRTRIRR
jgi:hypothetical protein